MLPAQIIPPAAPAPEAALAPEAVARLARLTRTYAHLSGRQAGLSSLLAGIFLWLVALVEVVGHGGRLTWVGAVAPLPLPPVLVVTTLPFLWLASRMGLRRWVTSHFGVVEPVQIAALSKRERLRHIVGRWAFPSLMLLAAVPVFPLQLSHPWLRVGLMGVLALTTHLAHPRLVQRLEQVTGILLFFAPALLLSGIQMAAADSLLAYPVFGTIALVLGLRDHLAFRRVRRELAA